MQCFRFSFGFSRRRATLRKPPRRRCHGPAASGVTEGRGGGGVPHPIQVPAGNRGLERRVRRSPTGQPGGGNGASRGWGWNLERTFFDLRALPRGRWRQDGCRGDQTTNLGRSLLGLGTSEVDGGQAGRFWRGGTESRTGSGNRWQVLSHGNGGAGPGRWFAVGPKGRARFSSYGATPPISRPRRAGGKASVRCGREPDPPTRRANYLPAIICEGRGERATSIPSASTTTGNGGRRRFQPPNLRALSYQQDGRLAAIETRGGIPSQDRSAGDGMSNLRRRRLFDHGGCTIG